MLGVPLRAPHEIGCGAMAPEPTPSSQAERWKDDPDEHDYPAAHEFLCLMLDTGVAKRTVRELRTASVRRFKAKDLIRASNSVLLSFDDVHVAADLAKVDRGERLSPVLLVRGSLGDYPLVIADGFHRICASYHLNENAEIPCRIVKLAH